MKSIHLPELVGGLDERSCWVWPGIVQPHQRGGEIGRQPAGEVHTDKVKELKERTEIKLVIK